jgi:hypothetical protein
MRIKESIKNFLIKDELEEYNKKTIDFHNYINSINSEIDNINNNKLIEINQLKNTYYEKI